MPSPAGSPWAAKLLTRLGCEVEVAENGARAVELLARGRYHLVPMDCQMPELDGYEASTEIRRPDRGRRIPIVAMIAHAMEGDRERCLAAGMDDYLTKRVSRGAPAAALRRWLPAGAETRV